MSTNKLVQLLNEYEHTYKVLETKKVLSIKPITTGQMKAILQYEGEEDATLIDKILDDIINGCVVTEGFDVNEMTLQDRFELLIAIRKISKGNTYNFNIKCPKCGGESIQAVDLDALELKPFPEKIGRKVKINDNLTLTMDFVRRGQQQQAVDLVAKMGKLNENQRYSEIATYMYALGIKGIENSNGPVADITVEDKKEFLDNLSAMAYEKINNWYEKYNYGTVFKYKVKCKSGVDCKFEAEEDIPITGFFF